MPVSNNTDKSGEFSLKQLDLNLLRVFDAIMRERSVTKAAKRLGCTQPAVSHALTRLRDIFDDDLFLRNAGVMEPTSRANELSITVLPALEVLRQSVERNINFDPLQTRRSFYLCVTDYTAMVILPQLIQKLGQRAPHASLNVTHAHNTEIVTQLKSRGVDCAVIANFSANDAHLTELPLTRDRMVCAGWSGNPALKNMSLSSYLDAPHLQISSDGRSEGLMDEALRKRKLTRKS